MARERPSILTVSVILTDGDKVLLVREAKPEFRGRWNHPSGHIDGNESPMQAARREVKEETGYDIVLFGRQTLFIAPSDKAYFFNFCYEAEVRGESTGKLADDILETRWFTRKEAMELPHTDMRSGFASFRMNTWLRDALWTNPVNIIPYGLLRM